MLKFIWLPILVVLAIIAGRYFYYAQNSTYLAPERPLPETEFDRSVRSERLEVVDNPAVSKGVIVIDYIHSNALFIEELNVLLSKVVSRGYSYEIALAGLSEESDSAATVGLSDKLRYAQALVLPLPRVDYTPEEIAEIKKFVQKGGRLLIMGDPTRTVVVESLNTIAAPFGIIYANDYLYSQSNNDTNYRNVVYSNFNDSPLTTGLSKENKVIFYAGGSLSAPGHEIILGDETTHSSVSEGGRAFAAAALTTNDQVLALTDLTFLSEPYSAAESNGVLINNIADFLTGGKRDLELKDFPFFLNPQVDIVYDNSLVLNSQFDNSVKLKEFLEQNDRKVSFTDKIGQVNDVIFVGRFDQVDVIKDYLADGGINILDLNKSKATAEPTQQEKFAVLDDETPGVEDRFITGQIQIAGVGDLERGGSTLFYLNRQEERNILIILSDTPETNADAFDLLFENRLLECRLSEVIAVCHTQEPDGQLPPSLRSRRIDKILVISGDAGQARPEQEPGPTGEAEFVAALSTAYKVDKWIISERGSPDVDRLLNYDAVIWATGDYWDDSLSDDDVAAMSKYIELGGNLILAGASIAFDWDHTDFLAKVAHADYLMMAEQTDLALLLPDHPIAAGFTADETITFAEVLSGTTETDVVNYTADARVIFQRGPNSEQPGAPAVIAYEDDRSKIGYLAFPIYRLPEEQRNRLIENMVSWFSEKPLSLPSESDYVPFEPSLDETPPPAAEPTPEGGEGGEDGGETTDPNTEGGSSPTGE
jgi:hypothetical protein